MTDQFELNPYVSRALMAFGATREDLGKIATRVKFEHDLDHRRAHGAPMLTSELDDIEERMQRGPVTLYALDEDDVGRLIAEVRRLHDKINSGEFYERGCSCTDDEDDKDRCERHGWSYRDWTNLADDLGDAMEAVRDLANADGPITRDGLRAAMGKTLSGRRWWE